MKYSEKALTFLVNFDKFIYHAVMKLTTFTVKHFIVNFLTKGHFISF